MELAGRRVIVTGATSGIGRELARVFTSRGAQVGLAVRDVAKGQALATELGANAELLSADFASMASIRTLAQQLMDSGRPVDILMLNAGVFGQPFRLTSEGFEATFASNYLGHFLLVHLLGAAGAFAPGARIVTTQTSSVSSRFFAPANLEMLTTPSEKKFSSLSASPSSKVLLALMSRTLAARAQGQLLSVGVNPGAVQTGNIAQSPALFRPLVRALSAPVEEGVEPLVWAATASADQLVSGQIYDRRHQPVKTNRDASDDALAARAWSESERILGLQPWPR